MTKRGAISAIYTTQLISTWIVARDIICRIRSGHLDDHLGIPCTSWKLTVPTTCMHVSISRNASSGSAFRSSIVSKWLTIGLMFQGPLYFFSIDFNLLVEKKVPVSCILRFYLRAIQFSLHFKPYNKVCEVPNQFQITSTSGLLSPKSTSETAKIISVIPIGLSVSAPSSWCIKTL